MNAPALDLVKARRALDARGRAFADQLRAWQRRLFRREMNEALRDPHRYTRGKKRDSEPPPPANSPEEELRQLMLRFGLRRGVEVANQTAGDEIIPGTLVADAIRKKPVKIQWFWHWTEDSAKRARQITEEHKDLVRESVRQIIADAEADADGAKVPLNEVVRRIARQVHALPESGEAEVDKVYAFGWERAAVIARTELAQVENTGKMAGFEALGIEEIEWMAYSDGLSGERHHERLNGKRIKVGGTFTDGLGNELRYPADPAAPIASTINCRCTMRPATRGRR